MDWAALRGEALAGFDVSSIAPSVELPALPYVVTFFVQRSRDKTVQMQELAAILETDSALTIKLLKHVNSSATGLRNNAKTVLQALSLLGIGRSRLFVIATGIEAATRSRFSKLIDHTVFWSNNLQKAIFAREVAMLLRTDADLAFIGGLLQDFLVPFLTNDLSDQYHEFLPLPDTATTLSELEQDRFGWDHGLVGACLAHAWNLPDEFVCCILYHHGGLPILIDANLGRSPVAATALSALLPDQFSPGDHGLQLLAMLECKWPGFCLVRLAESVDRQHEELGLGIRTGSSLLERCKKLGIQPCALSS